MTDTNELDTGTATIRPSETSFKVHEFYGTVVDKTVRYQVVKMEGSSLIWIGSGDGPKFASLSLAMISPYERDPLSTSILGRSTDNPSTALAAKLTKRLGKPIYVSFNLQPDRMSAIGVEERLLEEVKNCPDNF